MLLLTTVQLSWAKSTHILRSTTATTTWSSMPIRNWSFNRMVIVRRRSGGLLGVQKKEKEKEATKLEESKGALLVSFPIVG